MKKRGSLLWGSILIALGAIFLLKNFGFGLSFWKTAGQYWPLLLVVFGLQKIFDYYRLPRPRGFGAGDFFLLLFIIGFGLLAGKVARIDEEWLRWAGNFRIWKLPPISELRRNSYRYSEELSYPVAAGSELLVENLGGELEIVAAAGGELKVGVRKVVYEDSSERAREIAEQIKVWIEKSSGRVALKTNRDELKGRNYDFKVDLTLHVPARINVKSSNKFGGTKVSGLEGEQEIEAVSGPIEVSDLKGNLVVRNTHGATTVADVTGNVTIAARHGRVRVERVGGDLSVQNYYAPIEVSEVSGLVSLKNNYSAVRASSLKGRAEIEAPGSSVELQDLASEARISSSYRPVRVERAAGNIFLNASYASLRAEGIGGDLSVEPSHSSLRAERIGGSLLVKGSGSRIEAADIKGRIEISTSLKDVAVSDFQGQLKIQAEHGDVIIEARRPLSSNIEVKSEYGKVELYLPEAGGFEIEAAARSGQIRSDFQAPDLQLVQNGDARLSGVYGRGGSKIKIDTRYGNIYLRKAGRPERREQPELHRPRLDVGKRTVVVSDDFSSKLERLIEKIEEQIDFGAERLEEHIDAAGDRFDDQLDRLSEEIERIVDRLCAKR